MSLKGIDVSAYQGIIDWSAVKNDGMEFAILKIIRKDLNRDKQFEANWKGANDNHVIVQGVYNYTYATTVSKARTDAKKVLEILNGRKAMVWLDVEDECLKNLKGTLVNIINAYGEVIQNAGLRFGVYTGQFYYNNYIKPYGEIHYPFWLARYGKNTGEMDLNYKPTLSGMIGWQYTSKGRVNGIQGDVDMDVWYEDIIEEEKDIAALQKMDIQKGNPQQFAQIVKNIKTALNLDFGLSFLIDETIDEALLINLANVNLSTKAYTYNTTYALTQLLKWWGYGIEPTSQYGNAVSAIISTFQSQVGITVTGTTTADTWKKLLGK